MPIQKHVCGLCEKEFNKEKQYVDHVCKSTGHNPKELEHFGDEFKQVSEAARKRARDNKV